MHILSKSTYIKGEQCHKALYMLKKHPYLRDKLSLDKRAKFKRGTDVGVLARTLFPGGINMTPSSPSLFEKMFHKTMENVNNPDVNVLYEAVFIYDDTLIMLDILVRDGEKWRAIEVKSSMSVSETYRKDASLQYYVLQGCNIPVSDIQIMYINPNYVRNGELDLGQLFIYESVKDYAEERHNHVKEKISFLKDVLKLNNSPIVDVGTQCFSPYTCEFLGHCWKKIPQNSFLHTTALSDKDLFSIYNSGIKDNKGFRRFIDDISLGMNQLEALEQDTYYIDYKKFYELIGKKTDSTAFINILFHRPAVPVLNGHKPYQDMVLAFSISSLNNEDSFSWDCLDDFSKMEEGLELLVEKTRKFEKVIYFSNENINNVMQHQNLSGLKDIAFKLINMRDVLMNADFYSRRTKYDFSLKSIYEEIFRDEKAFEHSRILLNATSDNVIERALVRDDMEDECLFLQKIYRHFIS